MGLLKYKNLSILGTSHIAQQSLQQVYDLMEKQDPDIVALEIDKGRMAGLMSKEKKKPRFRDISKLGFKAYFINKLGSYAESKLGESVGVEPGSEMKLAYTLARTRHKKIALIDQDIRTTIKRLKLTWKEKFRVIPDLIRTVFVKNKIPFDLRNVPDEDTIKFLLAKVKKNYPTVYRVLVVERNEFMANRLFNLMLAFPNLEILAVVGAGHAKDILDLVKLKYKETQTISDGKA